MSKIEWCDITWNPITGCSPISEGCQNCYAARMANRLQGRFGYPAKPNQFDVTFHADRVQKPSKWLKPKRIFTCSMSDLFHSSVEWHWQYKILEMAMMWHHHTFILLTKRPCEMAKVLNSVNFQLSRNYQGRHLPLDNLWLGVTTETQERADERIPVLLQIPAAVRFMSVEPMLERINLEKYLLHCADCGNRGSTAYVKQEDNLCQKVCIKQGEGPALDWCIAGPETGPKARPCDPKWIEDLYQQCQEAGIPFFDKRKTDRIAREFPK